MNDNYIPGESPERSQVAIETSRSRYHAQAAIACSNKVSDEGSDTDALRQYALAQVHATLSVAAAHRAGVFQYEEDAWEPV